MNVISSKDNAAVKQLKRWLDKPKRSDATIVLEGIHLAQAYFENGWMPERIWVAQSALNDPEIKTLLSQTSSRVDILSDTVFRSVSTLAQGESILCEVVKSKPVAQLLDAKANAILIDGVQDAGNLGSILRSAAAAGVVNVYLNDACVNPFSPKVLRAGVGAHFSLNIIDAVDLSAAVIELQAQGVKVLATDLKAQNNIYQTDLRQPTAWLLGSEGSGVSAELIDAASAAVIIPMVAGESLNVAAAAAVCLFEMARQQATN